MKCRNKTGEYFDLLRVYESPHLSFSSFWPVRLRDLNNSSVFSTLFSPSTWAVVVVLLLSSVAVVAVLVVLVLMAVVVLGVLFGDGEFLAASHSRCLIFASFRCWFAWRSFLIIKPIPITKLLDEVTLIEHELMLHVPVFPSISVLVLPFFPLLTGQAPKLAVVLVH